MVDNNEMSCSNRTSFFFPVLLMPFFSGALDESDQDKTIGQCSDVDFENMFSSKSERTRKCLQSWYDYKWKCSCTYSK